jgi:hypothetical protein
VQNGERRETRFKLGKYRRAIFENTVLQDRYWPFQKAKGTEDIQVHLLK